MGCIVLVRYVLVLRCGLAGMVWYPYAGWSLHTDTTPPQPNHNVTPTHIETEQYNSWKFFFMWRCGPTRAMASSFLRFLDHTQRHITVGRTPLDAWSARRRDLYLTTHNTHNRRTSIPPVGFEPTISAVERPQTYALDRAATGTGNPWNNLSNNSQAPEGRCINIRNMLSGK